MLKVSFFQGTWKYKKEIKDDLLGRMSWVDGVAQYAKIDSTRLTYNKIGIWHLLGKGVLSYQQYIYNFNNS